MCDRTIKWKKSWIVGILLAFLVGPTMAADLFIPGAFDEEKALLGTWKTLETDEHGAFQPLGLSLKRCEQGRCFMLAVADAQGKFVHKVKGEFTFTSGVLKLTVDGKPYAEMNVKFADDALDLRTGTKSTHWVKDRP